MKWNIGWGITSACNMNCEFCYSKKVRSGTTDLPIEACYQFIDENHDYINSINYGTGENPLVDEWFDLIDYIKQRYNISQALTTNGYIFEAIKNDKNKYDKFVNSISEVDVSIDYSDPEKHNMLRGNPNVYNWAVNTLELCNKEGIISTIVFVGMRDNLCCENIDGLFTLAKE